MKLMKKLTLLFLLLSLTFGACQDKYPDLEDGIYAEIITNKGTFIAKLYHEATPLTVANFVSLAEGTNDMVDTAYAGKKFYNGLTFHRVMANFMIQGGDPEGTGRGGPGYRFPDEFGEGLAHSRKGLLSMANYGPGGTNGSQFFVTLKDTPWLDGIHSIFGEVVQGQDVVDAIGVLPTSQPGDKPLEDVIMNEVNIINKGNIKMVSFTEAMAEVEKKEKEKLARIAEVSSEKSKELNTLIEQGEELASGLKVYWNQKGKGMKPAIGSNVTVHCTGYFADGSLFYTTVKDIATKYDAIDPNNSYAPMPSTYSPEAKLIPGFREGLLQMSIGDKITLYIPAHLAYGAAGRPPAIPPNSDLIFELELLSVAE